MKNYWKEIVIFVIQIIMFYLFPLSAGPTDMMGLVVVLLFAVFVLSILMGAVSDKKVKYGYPALTAVMFLPTIFIYYNESALVHALWYLVDGFMGLMIGVLIRELVIKMKKSSKILIVGFVLCIVITVVGFFLYTSLIPIQDFDLLTQAEKIAFQKETAINYPLGNIMFHGGIIGSIICAALLIVSKIKRGSKV